MQINIVGNDNETGYAHHLIFDCKKKIRALSRLQGYISEILIRRYIKEAIEKSVKAISTNKPSIPLAVISWTPSNEWKLSASNPSSKSYTVNRCLNSSCSKLDEMTESLIVPKDNSYKVSMTDLCGNVNYNYQKM